MNRTVYIDVLFSVNFILNYLMLFSTGALYGSVPKRWRMALSALIGTLYAVGAFFLPLSLALSLIFKLALVPVMACTAFGRNRLVSRSLALVAVSFAFAGAVFGMYIAFGGVVNVKNCTVYIKIPMHILLIITLCAYAVFKAIFHRRATFARRNLRRVDVSVFERCVSFYALEDTGNSLCDPLTDTPVIICEFDTVREVLPESVARVFQDFSEPEIQLELMPRELKFRLIPFRTVSSEFSVLAAFKPTEVRVDKRQENYLIAVSKSKISDGSFAAII